MRRKNDFSDYANIRQMAYSYTLYKQYDHQQMLTALMFESSQISDQ